MDECTDDNVRRLIGLVPQQRVEQALRYRFVFGQYACLKSYAMLAELTGMTDMTFGYGKYGKPFLIGYPDIHFSISHCRKAIAVAAGDVPVGVDVESLRRVDEALIEKTMNNSEQAMIHADSDPDMEFVRLWTRKEAVLKLRGTGITDNLHDVLLGPEHIETHTCEGYAWSLAAD